MRPATHRQREYALFGKITIAYRQPIVYNFQVAREFLKQIYVAERLQPPSLSTVRSVYSTLWANATSPAYLRELVNSGAYLKVGVYAVEAYGIFKVSILEFALQEKQNFPFALVTYPLSFIFMLCANADRILNRLERLLADGIL